MVKTRSKARLQVTETLNYSGEVIQLPKRRRTAANSISDTKRRRRARTGSKRKNMMKEEDRKAFLERDEWARDVQPRSVTCGGCNKVFSLDKRKGAYYSGLWLKHRDACRAIRRLRGRHMETERQEQVNGRAALQDIDTDIKLMRLVASESTNTDGALPAGSQTLAPLEPMIASRSRESVTVYSSSAVTSDDLWSNDVLLGAWHLTCLSRRMKA